MQNIDVIVVWLQPLSFADSTTTIPKECMHKFKLTWHHRLCSRKDVESLLWKKQ